MGAWLSMKSYRSIKTLSTFMFLLSCAIFINSCGKKKNTKLAQTYFKLSMLELSSPSPAEQNYRQALLNIEKAIECEQKPEYLALKATLLFNLAYYKESQQTFKQALAISKDPYVKADILNNFACLLVQSNKKDDALKIWHNLQQDKDYLTPEVAFVNEGKYWFDNNQYKKSQECFIKAINIAPQYVDAHYYLAVCAHKSNDLSLAKNELGTVLYLEPEHSPAKNLTAQINRKSQTNMNKHSDHRTLEQISKDIDI